jgi:hypothetical protein
MAIQTEKDEDQAQQADGTHLHVPQGGQAAPEQRCFVQRKNKKQGGRSSGRCGVAQIKVRWLAVPSRPEFYPGSASHGDSLLSRAGLALKAHPKKPTQKTQRNPPKKNH